MTLRIDTPALARVTLNLLESSTRCAVRKKGGMLSDILTRAGTQERSENLKIGEEIHLLFHFFHVSLLADIFPVYLLRGEETAMTLQCNLQAR